MDHATISAAATPTTNIDRFMSSPVIPVTDFESKPRRTRFYTCNEDAGRYRRKGAVFGSPIKTSGMFWGVAVTTKTVSILEVVETQNYKIDQTTWNEAQQDDINELQRIAVKDKIKFVKIPNKEQTDEQLEKARTMCKEPS